MEKRYWLRGGVIGAIFAVVTAVLFFSCLHLANDPGKYSCLLFGLPINLGAFFVVFLPVDSNLPSSLLYPAMTVSGTIVWFLIGAVFGWLYNKIKNQTKSK